MDGILVLAALGLFAATVFATDFLDTRVWDTIHPSAELKWQKCFEDSGAQNLLCAKLTVPLDYESPSIGTLDIPFMKFVHREAVEDIIYNPGELHQISRPQITLLNLTGGPAESGPPYIVQNGLYVAETWGLNLVTFDPRGVGLNTLQVSCGALDKDNPALDFGLSDLRETWDVRLAQNKACSEYNANTTARYVGTVAVAEDIKHYFEVAAQAKGQNPEEALVNYWGTSYGTIIGQTLAALHPNRIGRVLLDGNEHGISWYQGFIPSMNADDFVYCAHLYAKLCFDAGPKWCAIATGMNSLDMIKGFVDRVFAKLFKNPLELTFSDLSNIVVSRMRRYAPRSHLPVVSMAAVGSDSEADGVVDFSLSEPADTAVTVSPHEGDDVLRIIVAMDIAGRYPWHTFDEYKAAYERAQATTPYTVHGELITWGLLGLAMDSFIPPKSQFFPGFNTEGIVTKIRYCLSIMLHILLHLAAGLFPWLRF
ncbi:hypothetical protein M011DRAFT_62745 [Sporormia fimetaria CBS 119925]|uniref:AB hydrolase-1 domain-containing protein n=1 Tax=Sporormia fimetaria CBS 119925 TaxID=1340428 RepID=A0A6A6VBJ5_9PLEO|nr:hypothetical protein M011DRAFT_62745 [Sporormia fimetaria CBS 119925]